MMLITKLLIVIFDVAHTAGAVVVVVMVFVLYESS